jgi:hypothetical protein
MFRRIALVAILVCAILPISIAPASGGNSGTVPCTVEIAAPLISIALDFPYGNPDFGPQKLLDTPPWLQPNTSTDAYVTITNDGNVTEDIWASGTYAMSTEDTSAVWALNDALGSNGLDEYKLMVGVASTPYVNGWFLLSTAAKPFTVPTLDPTQGTQMGMRLYTPGSTSKYGQYSFAVLLTATAH